MQWFKHDSDASADAKIKKLLLKYGAVGYAIYFHCIELIVSDISESNITFELEHDAEIIADNLKIKGTAEESGIDIVNKVMKYIVELGLFENYSGHITCYKILKRLDTSMTSNQKFREIISNAKKDGHVAVMMDHDSVMQDENRSEENRGEENTSTPELPSPEPKKKPGKHKYGEYQNVLLTESEFEKLQQEYPDYLEIIKFFSEAKEMKGYKYKSDYLAIRSWGVEAAREKSGRGHAGKPVRQVGPTPAPRRELTEAEKEANRKAAAGAADGLF